MAEFDSSNLDIVNNEEENRFETTVDGKVAVAEYMRSGNNIIFTHTEVPVELEGRGIANQLAEVALKYAKDQGFKVQPLCPFIRAYVLKHPEYKAISWGM